MVLPQTEAAFTPMESHYYRTRHFGIVTELTRKLLGAANDSGVGQKSPYGADLKIVGRLLLTRVGCRVSDHVERSPAICPYESIGTHGLW